MVRCLNCEYYKHYYRSLSANTSGQIIVPYKQKREAYRWQVIEQVRYLTDLDITLLIFEFIKGPILRHD